MSPLSDASRSELDPALNRKGMLVGVATTLTSTYIAGYGRISEADDDEGVGNQRYFFDEWAAAERPSAAVRWFFDNDITGTTGDRGGFDDLREAIQRGEVTELWVRDQSRLQRNEEVWFALRGELLAAGVAYIETRNKGRVAVDDLVTSIQACIDADRVRQDRKNLMDRQKRDADKGRPPATKVYGYRPAVVDRERTLQVVPEQAEIIRWIAHEILSGRSTSSICTELKRRGERGARGALISTSTMVESIVTNPTVAGFRRYQGDLVLGDDGKPLRGNWPAILDVDTWHDVRTVVATRRNERKASSPRGGAERRRYVLSGLVRCERCDEAMYGTRVRGRQVYKCKRCGALAAMHMVDDIALNVVAERLLERKRAAEAMATEDNAARREEIHRALDGINARRTEVRQDRDDDLIDRDEYRGSLRRLNERRDALQAELSRLVQPSSADDPGATLHLLTALTMAMKAEDDPEAKTTLRALAHEWLTSVVVAPHVRGQAPENRIEVE